MPSQSDPLVVAAAAYATENWGEEEWRQFGRDTGTIEILNQHPRLYRSLGFGDPDYADAAIEAMGKVLREAPEKNSGDLGRMEIVADAMPELRAWILRKNAPPRTTLRFIEYLRAMRPADVPSAWRGDIGSPADRVVAGKKPAVVSPVEPPHIVAEADSVPEIVAPSRATKVAKEINLKSETPPEPTKIFIVHGHDETALNAIRVFVTQQTGIMPVSLAEEPGAGDTIIEKFERIGGEAKFVIVLLTPDDVGQSVGDQNAGRAINLRARQNVVLELGYFIGKMSRKSVVVVDAGVERPSDLAGLSYVAYGASNWQIALQKELRVAGFAV